MFPFSPAGLMAAARRLAGEHVAAPDKPTLRPLHKIEPVIALWAAAAAYVPHPSWRQLESLRLAFSDLHATLDHPGYYQRLIDWLYQREAETDPLVHGHRLDIDTDISTELMTNLRATTAHRHVETRVCRLLIEQLSSASPESELQRLLRDLKRDMHETRIHPERLAALIKRYESSVVATEMRVMVAHPLLMSAHGTGSGSRRSGSPPPRSRKRSGGRSWETIQATASTDVPTVHRCRMSPGCKRCVFSTSSRRSSNWTLAIASRMTW